MTVLGLDLGPHAAFIWAAYAFGVAVLTGLTGWIVADERRQRRRIAQMVSQGASRRAPDAALPPQVADAPVATAEASGVRASGKPPAKAADAPHAASKKPAAGKRSGKRSGKGSRAAGGRGTGRK